jgi:hypothetical protein
MPGATTYEVYKDGQKIGETSDTTMNIGADGSVTVVGKDASGNTVGQADAPPGSGSSSGGSSSCDVCEQLRQALACPEWDTYMGEVTNAVRNAFDWPSIADTFVGKFADYFGDVPEPPTKAEIDQQIRPDLPGIDTVIPEANIAPEAPNEFDQPVDFDITTGPEISVEDGSEPIEIYEPDQFINADTPGEMVYPGDSRNSSDGIKQPDTITTPYTTPVPTTPSGSTPPPSSVPTRRTIRAELFQYRQYRSKGVNHV